MSPTHDTVILDVDGNLVAAVAGEQVEQEHGDALRLPGVG